MSAAAITITAVPRRLKEFSAEGFSARGIHFVFPVSDTVYLLFKPLGEKKLSPCLTKHDA